MSNNSGNISNCLSKQMGVLKINHTKYPIYEGLNLVGRDLKARVVLNGLACSKQHAFIIVVDTNTHFISDFSSSNGTQVNNSKLIPFKLYQIKNEEQITFGDVIGVYYTNVQLQSTTVDSCTETQAIDFDAETQNLCKEINIHDLPTQYFDNTKQIYNETTQNIHEAETQKTDEATEEYVVDKGAITTASSKQEEEIPDFFASEMFDDVFANESFRLSLKSASKTVEEVEETQLIDKLDDTKDKDDPSGMDDDIILSTQDNALIEQKTEEVLKKDDKENDLKTDVIEDEKGNNSESETDDDLEIKQTKDKPDTSKLEDTETNKKKIDDEKCNKNLEQLIVNKKTDDNGSETDEDLEENQITVKIIANHEPNKNVENMDKNLTTNENDCEMNSDDDIDLLIPTPVVETAETKTNDSLLDNKEEDSIFLAPTQLLTKSKPINKDEDAVFLAPTQLLTKNKQIDGDDDDLPPTQLLKTPTKTISHNKEDENDEDLPPTQLLGNQKRIETVEDVFSAPTQKLEQKRKTVNFSEDVFLISTQKLNENSSDVFMAPTQLLPETKTNESTHDHGNKKEESIDTSMKLVLSETDDSICKGNSVNIKELEKNAEPETQLEVDFALETQKLYIEEKTSRPNNPLVQVLVEDSQSEKTQEILPTKEMEKKKIENFPSLQVKLLDYKYISVCTNKTPSKDDFKLSTRKRKTNKMQEKTPKLNVQKVKKDDGKSSEIVHNTRGKRINYSLLNSGEKEKKLIVTPKIKETPVFNEDVFVNKRITRTRSSSKQLEKNEDSDSSLESPKKKVRRLTYSDDSESILNTEKRITRTSKQSTKIEEYSSDESPPKSVSTSNKKRKFDPLEVTVSCSQISNLNQNKSSIFLQPLNSIKHKVVFTMLNDVELENSVQKLGGTIIDSAHDCTVLVTNKISRSLKFLIAVALGKPIVNQKWLLDSKKKNSFQDPWNYILKDKEGEDKFNFSLKESLSRSNNKKLLTGCSILLATKNNFSVLKEIITTSGGKFLSRTPGKNVKAFVVSYEEDKAKYSKYLKQKNLTVVSAESIFAGVLKQELNWKEHLLK